MPRRLEIWSKRGNNQLVALPYPGVRAVLGHFFFVYIHPYMDGNGRLGRFLMNALFASSTAELPQTWLV